ncbi:spore germination protein [Alicyclobacillus kakegawensis]|uniref:spore germination protein n=1 Tax=Alicyclobacillus kakegawensis TaxID=392012 RepID=UPI0009F8FA26|nr:spore germination protein [Alicyclobacillus kakegawensis]
MFETNQEREVGRNPRQWDLDKQHVPPISRNLQDNVDYLNRLLGVGYGPGNAWDLMAKPFRYGGLNMMAYVLNGYFTTTNLVLILDNFERQISEFVTRREGQGFSIQELAQYLNTHIGFVQVQPFADMGELIRQILSGPMVIFIDGFDVALLIDTRIYPMRSIGESEIERTVRGPRDGFVETMLFNVALIRRRLKDPRIRTELLQVGNRSKTDVTIMYLQDVTNPELVDHVRIALNSIDVDATPMAEQAITDQMMRVKWNPYPIVRYTERADVAATALVDGHVLIIPDTTPEVIIAPITFFQLLQNPGEYHSYPLVGTYMRWVVLLSVLLSTLLPGIFLVVNLHPEAVPKEFSFFRADTTYPLPIWMELLIVELGLDVLRMAMVNIPSVLASSVSIVAAVIFGEFASKIQLFQPEVLVYMAFVLIAQFAISSFELANANALTRLFLILVTEAGFAVGIRAWGFLVGVAAWVLLLATTRSLGVPYLWPLIPFRWKNGLQDILLRKPMSTISGRPEVLRPRTAKRKG